MKLTKTQKKERLLNKQMRAGERRGFKGVLGICGSWLIGFGLLFIYLLTGTLTVAAGGWLAGMGTFMVMLAVFCGGLKP